MMRLLQSAALALVLAASMAGAASELEIKGLRIGMTEEQIVQAIGSMTPKGFTVAGIPSYYARNSRLPLDPGVQITMDEGKMVRFIFLFPSRGFDHIKSAFVEKYPAMRCTESKIVTRAGAELPQVDCETTNQGVRLTVRQYVGDIDTGALTLESLPFAATETQQDRARRRKDI